MITTESTASILEKFEYLIRLGEEPDNIIDKKAYNKDLKQIKIQIEMEHRIVDTFQKRIKELEWTVEMQQKLGYRDNARENQIRLWELQSIQTNSETKQ